MSLTQTQFNTLKAAIIANPTAGPLRTAGDVYSLQLWCNAASAQLAWNRAVSPQISDEAATYTTYDTLAQGKRDSWAIFLMFIRDYGKVKIRNWITDIWGNATAGSIAEAILQAGTKAATNAQVAIGGTAKTTGTVTALKLNYEEDITIDEVSRLVN